MQPVQLRVGPLLAEDLRVALVEPVDLCAGLDDGGRANHGHADAAEAQQHREQDSLLGAGFGAGEAEEGERGDEVGVAEDGDRFATVLVDGPAADGAEEDVEDAEGDEEEGRFEGGVAVEGVGVGGDGGVVGGEDDSLD